MDRKRPRIAVVGSANVDLIMNVKRFPEPGETLSSGRFSVATGGKGANQAVSLARLGADVVFVGRVGNDQFGDICVQNLKGAGISTDLIVRDGENHTGTVVILVDSEGQNTAIPDYGANLHLSASDIESAADAIRSSDILLLQFEVPEEANRQALTIAEDGSVPVLLNPAPRVPASLELLKRSWLVTPNLAEASALSRLAGAFLPGSLLIKPEERAL